MCERKNGCMLPTSQAVEELAQLDSNLAQKTARQLELVTNFRKHWPRYDSEVQANIIQGAYHWLDELNLDKPVDPEEAVKLCYTLQIVAAVTRVLEPAKASTT